MPKPKFKAKLKKGKKSTAVAVVKKKGKTIKDGDKGYELLPPNTVSVMRNIYASRLDTIERKRHLTSDSLSARTRFSSGVLVADLIMGGGLLPGMYSTSGPEASAKSTLQMHILKSACEQQIAVVDMFDAEGCVDPRYTGNIFGKKLPMQAVFSGTKDQPKLARYYQENTIEGVFDSLADILRMMPNKVYSEEIKQWCYVFPKHNKHFSALLSESGMKPDKHLSVGDRFYCPTEYDGIEGISIVDSWPALVPEVIDEEDSSKAMALMAREFSKHLPRIKGKLRRKGMILSGVNQIRLNPGARNTNPEYEPGGEALKFHSDCRNQLRARAVPDGWDRDKEKGGLSIEDSAFVEETSDNYAYKYMRNTKNKNGTPFLGGWTRVWVSDHKGQGRGFDPAFDVFEYLRMTGQLNGNKKGYTIDVGPLKGLKLDFYTLKCLVLAETENDKMLWDYACKEIGLKKPFKLRKACFSQLASGEGNKLMLDQTRVSEGYEDASEDDDIEDLD